MSSNCWLFIQPDSAIRTNRNGSMREFITEVTLSPLLDGRHFDLPSIQSD